jgi:prenyltransferase beta subunit
MRWLAGLWMAGQPAATLKPISAKLLAMQHADGGWPQTANLDSDAFGTAAALVSLRMSGALKSSDPAYRKGVDFLLSTQFPDGSWYVRSRAVKLQPYFEASFPFGHDQWISVSATAYAVMALAPMVAPAGR